MIQIVLHEPEIPFNTGAIGRSCVATDSPLHLIEPLGFVLNDKYVKRAGMDYWDKLSLHRYLDYEDFLQKHPEIVFAGEEQETTAARRHICGLRRPRRSSAIRMCPMARMTISCSARNPPGSRRRFWFVIRRHVCGFRCGETSAP